MPSPVETLSVVLVVLACVSFASVNALQIIPQAHSLTIPMTLFREERCVFSVARGPEDRFFVHVQFRTGSPNFEFEARGPEGSTIYLAAPGEIDVELKLYFEAKKAGEHHFCLTNGHGENSVMISVAVLSKRRAQKKVDPLLKSLAKSEANLIGLTENQVYMRARERDHRVTLETNNTRVAVRGVIEIIVMLLMSVGQVFFLKRLFKPKSRSV